MKLLKVRINAFGKSSCREWCIWEWCIWEWCIWEKDVDTFKAPAFVLSALVFDLQDDHSNESGASLFTETPSLSDEVPFEMMVLDKALDATTKKFNRHLKR